ncbi:MAG: S9 family peptidase, partial [Alistipes ihumii]|nr:S9 family peptidase [Alistipes ihumii]
MKHALLPAALLIAAGVLCTNCKTKMKISTLPYPVARMDSTVDDYFGTKVPDPYRWLEDDNSAETAAWVTAENEVTQNYLSQIPFRDKIRNRLTELWNYPKYGVPSKHGDYFFFFENDGLQNQSVLYRQKSLDGPAEVFLDPNKLSDDGTVALSDVSFSKDGKYCAYAAASSGSDWVEIRVMDVATRELLPDVIRWVKFSGAVWTRDGFYYSGYDEPKQSEALVAQNRFQKIFFHKLGTEQSADRLIYEDRAHPLRY